MRKLFFFLIVAGLFINPCFGNTVNDTIPVSPENILGTGRMDTEQLSLFLIGGNTGLNKTFVRDFAEAYVIEAAVEGVNHDIAWTQMCLETDFFRFNGKVRVESNNYGGISAGENAAKVRFPTPLQGIRGHVQRLKAFAAQGTAVNIHQLAGKWTNDPNYSARLKGMVDNLYVLAYVQNGVASNIISYAPVK
jgi:hypothetical protein